MLTCVRWYVAYPLSLRHIEEMMARARRLGGSCYGSPLVIEDLAGRKQQSIPPPATPCGQKLVHGRDLYQWLSFLTLSRFPWSRGV
jgi:hypothetical protein